MPSIPVARGLPVTRLRATAFAIWDFVVGDDWRSAIGVVLALGLTAIVAAAGASAWWVMPVAVPILLVISLRRFARRS